MSSVKASAKPAILNHGRPPLDHGCVSQTVNMKEQISKRWQLFAERTTIHGIREFAKTPSYLSKFLWLSVFAICTTFLVYQTYGMAYAYLEEQTVTEISSLSENYPTPRVMIGVPTGALLRWTRQKNSSLPEMDLEALAYARSIVENVTHVPGGVKSFCPLQAKKKFQEYLITNNVTWAQAIDPYVFDVSPWIVQSMHPDLLVSRRLVWYPLTYHVIEPIPRNDTNGYKILAWDHQQTQHHLFLDWNESPLGDAVKYVTLISYELLHDNFPLRRGDKFKLTFYLTAHSHLDLRKRRCRQVDRYYYKKYDEFSCRELCSLEAIMRQFPDVCVIPPHLVFSLLGFHPRGIPCSSGTFVLDSGQNFSRPYLRNLPDETDVDEITRQQIIDDARNCEKLRCFKPCKELAVHYKLNKGILADDQPENLAILTLDWPSPDEVVLFEEKLMYTPESIIGQWGGLAGLWLGASLMSFVEIVYFWCCCCFDREQKTMVEKVKF